MRSPDEIRAQFEKEESWKLEQIVAGKAGWSTDHQIAKDVLKQRDRAHQESLAAKKPSDPWYRKPLGIFFLAVCAALFVALCKMAWPNFLK